MVAIAALQQDDGFAPVFALLVAVVAALCAIVGVLLRVSRDVRVTNEVVDVDAVSV